MPSDKAQEWWDRHWWRREGYINEPVPESVPPGRTGAAIVRGVQAQNQINNAGEQPETYEPTASTETSTGRVPGHHRTLAAEYYPDSHILRVTSWGDPGPPYNYYNVSRDEWNTFCEVDSPGQYINAVLNFHDYGVSWT